MKLKSKRVLALCFLVVLALGICRVMAQTGTLKCLRTEYNIMYNGEKCTCFHFYVNAVGCKGRQIEVVAYVEHPKGAGVEDLNGKYRTSDGKVCTSTKSTASYDDSEWKDFKLYLPNSEIHPLPGENTYYVEALLWSGGKVLDRTYLDSFSMTGTSESGLGRQSNENVGNDVLSEYRENLSYGYKIVTKYRNGAKIEAYYTPCGMCGGTRRCGLCMGRGGMVTAGYGTYIPCMGCGQTGTCSLCNANNGYVLSNSIAYDANGNRIYAPLNSGGFNGGYSGGSSSGSSSSSRYGECDCPTCHGTGTCQTCYGDGVASSYYTGGSMACPNCRSNRGKCSVCGGTGKKYGVK